MQGRKRSTFGAVQLRLSFPGLPECPALHLSVDGMTESGPNLSHWPGNRTPHAWKADLSTGICLAFARAPEAEQRAFLGAADTVLNDHYDTDGFGSLVAILRPELAFAHEETLLLAATTGDFGVLTTPRAFAIDRTLAGLATERSPVAKHFAGLDYPARCLARYRFAIEHAEALLRGAPEFDTLWRDEHARIAGEVLAARSGAMERRVLHKHGLAVLTTRTPCSRMTLNTLAGAYRVLHVLPTAEGPLYRYHDRTESWFELVTIVPHKRRDLRRLAERLQQLEVLAGTSAGTWCADPANAPIPELYHGMPADQEYGAVTRTLLPSTLAPQLVERELVAFFAETESSS